MRAEILFVALGVLVLGVLYVVLSVREASRRLDTDIEAVLARRTDDE